MVDESVGAGLALQRAALDGLDPEQAEQLGELLRQLLAATETQPSGPGRR